MRLAITIILLAIFTVIGTALMPAYFQAVDAVKAEWTGAFLLNFIPSPVGVVFLVLVSMLVVLSACLIGKLHGD